MKHHVLLVLLLISIIFSTTSQKAADSVQDIIVLSEQETEEISASQGHYGYFGHEISTLIQDLPIIQKHSVEHNTIKQHMTELCTYINEGKKSAPTKLIEDALDEALEYLKADGQSLNDVEELIHNCEKYYRKVRSGLANIIVEMLTDIPDDKVVRGPCSRRSFCSLRVSNLTASCVTIKDCAVIDGNLTLNSGLTVNGGQTVVNGNLTVTGAVIQGGSSGGCSGNICGTGPLFIGTNNATSLNFVTDGCSNIQVTVDSSGNLTVLNGNLIVPHTILLGDPMKLYTSTAPNNNFFVTDTATDLTGVTGSNNIAMGTTVTDGSLSSQSNTVTIGTTAIASANNAIAIGNFARAVEGTSSIAIGTNTIAQGDNCVAIGTGAVTNGGQANVIVLGNTTLGGPVSFVAIGTSAPNGRFHVTDSFGLSQPIAIFDSSTNPSLTAPEFIGLPVQTGTTLVLNGTRLGLDTSSRRYKENAREIDKDTLEKLYSLDPIIFDFKKEHGGCTDQAGFYAEAVAEIFPEYINYEKDGITPQSIRQQCLTALAIKAIQGHKVQLDEHQTQLEEDYDSIDSLFAIIDVLEKRIRVLEEAKMDEQGKTISKLVAVIDALEKKLALLDEQKNK